MGKLHVKPCRSYMYAILVIFLTTISFNLISQCAEIDIQNVYFECNSDGTSTDEFYIDITFIPLAMSGTYTFTDAMGNTPTIMADIGDVFDFGVPSPGSYTLTSGMSFTYEFGPFTDGDAFDVTIETPNGCIIDVMAGTYDCDDNISGGCETDVPFYDLDFTGDPDGVFDINYTERFEECCMSGDRCVEFKITLDPNTEGISAAISGGGGYVYSVLEADFDCMDYPIGNEQNQLPNIQNDVCLTSGETFFVFICKSGTNQNEITINAIPKPGIIPMPEISQICDVDLMVQNLTNFTWSSVADPNLDNLTCATPCTDVSPVTFLYDEVEFGIVTDCDGVVYDYTVSGMPLNTSCSMGVVMASTTVTVFPEFNIMLETQCNDNGTMDITATPTGNGALCSYLFDWSNGEMTQTIVVDQDGAEYCVDVKRTANVHECAVVSLCINANCCLQSASCGIGDLSIQGCDLTVAPAPFTLPYEVFSMFESCSNDTLLQVEADTVGMLCFGGIAIERIYHLVVDMDTVASCMQTITITDTTDPTITAPDDITLEVCGVTSTTVNAGNAGFSYSDLVIVLTDADVLTYLGLPGALAADNCSFEISYQDDYIMSCPWLLTRTYTITDTCGNTAMDTQLITVDDTTDPVIVAPDDISIEACFADATTVTAALAGFVYSEILVTVDHSEEATFLGLAGALVTEACGYELTYIDVAAGTCPTIVTRTWTITDTCDNTAMDTQLITVDDTTDPVIVAPDDINIEACFADVTTVTALLAGFVYSETLVTLDHSEEATFLGLTGASVTEACGYELTYIDVAAGTCPTIVTRTWTIADTCDNTAMDTQLITVDDTTDPVIVAPDDISIEACFADATTATAALTGFVYSETLVTLDHSEEATFLGLTGVSVTEACGYELTYIDVAAGTCPTIVTRTWTITDTCDNTAMDTQLITVDDTTDPVIVAPDDISIEACFADATTVTVALTGFVYSETLVTLDHSEEATFLGLAGSSVTEACGYELTYIDVAAGTCPTIVTRTWTITDTCDNTAMDTQLITVDDTMDPVIVAPDDITLEACMVDMTTVDAANTGFDYSETLVTLTHSEEANFLGLMGASVTEACGYEITYIDVAAGTCPAVVTRTWTITDTCDNTAMDSQLISVGDAIDPIIVAPEDISIEACFADATTVTAADAGFVYSTTLVTLDHSEEATFFGLTGASVTEACGYELTYIDVAAGTCPTIVTRTWTIIDTCDNTAMDTQLITVDDTTDPVIVAPDDITLEACTADITTVTAGNTGFDYSETLVTLDHSEEATFLGLTGASVTEACGYEITYIDVAAGTCPAVVTRTWTITDTCDNTAMDSQLISVGDAIDPIIVAPDDITLEACTADITTVTAGNTGFDYSETLVTLTQAEEATFLGLTGASVTEACGYEITYIDSPSGTCPVIITRTYTITDTCDNVDMDSQLLSVGDAIDPIIVAPDDISIEACFADATTVTAADAGFVYSTTLVTLDHSEEATFFGLAGASVTEACGYELTYIDVAAGTCPTIVTRTWTIIDTCDNTAMDTQLITVDDTTDPVIVAPEDISIEACFADATTVTAALTGFVYSETLVTLDHSEEATFLGLAGSSVTEACGYELTYIDVAAGTCPTVITRTWTITDTCDNTAMDTQSITVDDTTDPVIVAPDDISIEACLADATTVTAALAGFEYSETLVTLDHSEESTFLGLTGATVTEACGYELTYIDVGAGTCPTMVTRTWTITDTCDNIAMDTQLITVDDTTDPVWNANQNLDQNVECGSEVITPSDPMAMDDCGTPVISVVSDVTTVGPSGCTDEDYVRVIKYVATDGCLNESDTFYTNIIVLDATPPVMDCDLLSDLVLECGIDDESDIDAWVSSIESLIDANVTDNCGGDVEVSNNYVGGLPPLSCDLSVGLDISFYIEDCVGNVDSCILQAFMDDTIAPDITCPPDISMETCDMIDITSIMPEVSETKASIPIVDFIGYGGVFSDECGVETIEYQDEITTMTDELIVIERTYYALDTCENIDSCVQKIELVELMEVAVSCKAVIHVSLDENCMAEITPGMVIGGEEVCPVFYRVAVFDQDGIDIGNIVDYSHIGTTITYELCSEITNVCCWGYLIVEDKLPPTVICDDVDIECNALNQVPDAIAMDNCGGAVLLVEEYHEFLDCDPDYIARVYRKWVARDNAGNESDTCYQTINLLRIDFGAIDFPGSMNLEFSCDGGYPVDENGHPHPDVTGIPTYTGTALWPVIPPNFCNGFVNYKDVVLFESGCHTRIMRTWEVGEWHCGGLVGPQLWVQMIELFDHEGPSITCPSDMTLSTTPTNYGQCTAMIDLPAAAVSDNCNEPVEVDVAYPGGFLDNQNGGEVTLPVGTHMITYTAYDGCYNSSECSFEVTIEDGTQPIIVCEQHTVVSIKQDGRAVVYAESFDDGSYDNCEIDRFEVRRMTDNCGIAENLIWGAHVEFCCADVGEEVMVMLRVYDTSANYNECMVTAIVQDKQTPFFYCPADMTVECTTNFDPDLLGDFFGMAGIMDNCDAPPVSEEADIDIDNCGLGTITRDFTLVDNNGIVQTCQQVITFINSDPLDESGIIWPLHYEGSDFCSIVGTDPEDLPAGFDVPVITEDECDLTGYNYDDSVHTFADGEEACFKILREWTVIDWCQRNSDGTLRTWEYTQVIKVFNTVAPTIDALSTIEVETFDVNCAAAHVDLVATGSDDCTSEEGLNWSYEIDEDRDGDVDYFGLGNDASGLYDIGIYTITWTVHDECGNFVSADQDFEVINAKPPTPICIYGLSTQLVAMDLDGDGDIDTEMVVLAPEYFDGGSNHQCGYAIDLSFSSDPNDDEIMFDCDDIGLDRPVELWVTDENGNQAYCETFIDVLDENGVDFCPVPRQRADVSGQVRTEGGAEMAEVSVELAGGDLLDMTDESGVYAFEDMPLGGDYVVSPRKNDDVMNGVSTLDLLLMQKHILGLDELEGPLNLISADINHNDEVTAVDLIELRKLILGIYEEFPHNTSWRFIDADHDFAVAADPWAEAIPEVYEIENLNSNMDIDFVGTKIGDVNGSAEAQMMGTEVESRSGNSLILDMSYSEEGTRIGVRSDDINGLEGLQMTLNTGAMMIVGIEGGAMEMKGTNYHIARNNEVRISWHVDRRRGDE